MNTEKHREGFTVDWEVDGEGTKGADKNGIVTDCPEKVHLLHSSAPIEGDGTSASVAAFL